LADVSGSPRPQRVLPKSLVRTGMIVSALLRRIYPSCPLPVGPGPLRFLATSRFIDIGRAREELGFVPRIGYREGLAGSFISMTGEDSVHSFQPGEPRAVPV